MNNIAIVIHNLDIGGVQKALVEFANQLAKKDRVTIYSLKKTGVFISKLSSNIDIKYLGPILEKYVSIEQKTFKSLTNAGDKIFKIFIKVFRIFKCEKLLYRFVTKKVYDVYDIAISYTGRPGIWDYIVKNRIKSVTKLAWIHNDPYRLGIDSLNVKKYYSKFDLIFNVSFDGQTKLNKIDKRIIEKNKVMYNLVDKKIIYELSKSDNKLYSDKIFNIISVLRLQLDSKRVDRIIDVVRKLQEDDVLDFCWHIVGDGPYYNQLKSDIVANDLNNYIKLYGFKANPYPFISQADVFCLVSDYEGLPVTLMEAKILNKPIVSTNIDSAMEIIDDGNDGVIVEKNADSIFLVLRHMITDSSYFNRLKQNSLAFNGFHEANIDVFYKYLEELHEK